MSRNVCPELYPDPRPSRLVAGLLPHLPRMARLLPWLAAAPATLAVATVLLALLPVMTWLLLSLAVLLPLAAGAFVLNLGWERAEAETP